MSERPPPVTGELIAGRYAIEDQVHSGGMSRVYLARDRETEQIVALKRPAKDDPGTLARFLEEAKILSELNHPAIVRQLAHGGTTFADAHMVMEWLSGETLEQRLAAGRLGLQDALSSVRRAAEGLSAAHRAKIVHRDLKPANLILCDGLAARTKLIDFGIARREAARGLSVHASFAGGTWAYMSPEQAMGSAELGARTDVYSLGCVFFEAISGNPAFPSDRAQAVVAKVWQPAPSLADFCVGLPKPLLTLVSKMLATDPMQRQRDGSALVTELLALGKLPDQPAMLKI
ncbi:MAG TPA: serine/threonine-protein kinase [Polyangiaceae bacterium]|jgi:serine/threonine protein kinase|nr:serine/threonine-protein kinase [Polyangiaceae bacterium]